jgi:hypothetical protein
MKHLAKMQQLSSRLPAVPEVAKAFESFFVYKAQQKDGWIEDTHAQLALQSFQYCVAAQSSTQTDGQIPKEISQNIPFGNQAIGWVARVLALSAPRSTSAHLELARALWEYVFAHWLSDEIKEEVLTIYVRLLCKLSNLHEARAVILASEAQYKSHATKSITTPVDRNPSDLSAASKNHHERAQGQQGMAKQSPHGLSLRTLDVLFGILLHRARTKGSEAELLDLRAMLEERNIPLDFKFARAMLYLNIRKNDFEGVQRWSDEFLTQYDVAKSGTVKNYAHALRLILTWSLQNDKLDFGHNVVGRVMAGRPGKRVWDEVLIWAAGCGKGADEIGRMLNVMVDSNTKLPEARRRYPDIDTINGLVEFAVSKDDPYLAERFIVIGKEIGEKLIKDYGQERGIQPNAQTYILQMEYRLRVKDVDGALVAYKNLQGMDLSENADIPIVNKLIVALCESGRHDFETVDNVVHDLIDRQARFDGNTVSSLAILHLDRDEFDDAQDLVGFHSGHFSLAERAKVRGDLISYITTPTTSVPRAWDAYSLLREFFDEIAREERTQIMLSFLTTSRFRPDLAADIFITMRQHTRRDTNPSAETYIAFFAAAPRHKDWTVHENAASSIQAMHRQLEKNRAGQQNAMNSVEVVHNQLKLDASITPSTRIYNSLMIAYIGGDRFHAALNFWNAINASKEGPTYNSIHLALRACENSARGDVRAAQIWSRLRSLNVEMDAKLWASYAAALVGNGDNRLGFEAVEKGVESGELTVDAFLLASMFDSGYGEVKENEIMEWAKERFPRQWKEVEEMGFYERPNGFKYVKGLNRDIEP